MQDSLWATPTTAYVRPTMNDVRAIPWNGLTVAGSFSGCGGSSLGLRMAGFRVPYAIEFVPIAAETYRANSPSTHVDERDVREIRGAEVLERVGVERGELDVFEGSPPCSSWSSAGSGEKGWGKSKSYSETRQTTDDLFWEYARLVDEMRPRAFIAENVPGMLRGVAVETYTHRITDLFAELGYGVDARVLNASHYGVPQDRRRLIFVGVRRDLGVAPSLADLPRAERVTLRQALAAAPPADPDELALVDMEPYAVGRTWRYLVDARERGSNSHSRGYAPNCERCGKRLDTGEHDDVVVTPSGFIQSATCADGNDAVIVKVYNMLVVPELDRPCPTLTATGATVGAASVAHPTECRKFTIPEMRALCGFPDDFVLVGSRKQRYERLGRAVPPPLMRAVGERVAELLRSAAGR